MASPWNLNFNFPVPVPEKGIYVFFPAHFTDGNRDVGDHHRCERGDVLPEEKKLAEDS